MLIPAGEGPNSVNSSTKRDSPQERPLVAKLPLIDMSEGGKTEPECSGGAGKVLMRQLKPDEHEHRQSLVFEYVRLIGVASESLGADNPRARPNWFRLYEAHEQMTKLIEKIRQINQH
jgi:hypothetical protein